jgi:hypothetical protein
MQRTRSLVSWIVVIFALAVVARSAAADPLPAESLATAPTAAPTAADAPRHAVYLDILGKGGLWGLGYEWHLRPRLAFGAVGSLYTLGGDQFLSLSPYVAGYPLLGRNHGWFIHLGPQVVRRSTPSPGPEWPGMTTTGFDAELSTGYEYRARVLLRAYVMAAAGAHLVPWLGASVGWTL